MLENLQTTTKVLVPAVPGRIVCQSPGCVTAAVYDRRRKAAVLIFANDFDLLLVTRKVTYGGGLARPDGGGITQLIAAPVVSVNVRQINVDYLAAR